MLRRLPARRLRSYRTCLRSRVSSHRRESLPAERQQHQPRSRMRNRPAVADPHDKADITRRFDASNDDDGLFGRNREVAGLQDLRRQAMHHRQRRLCRAFHRRMLHSEHEQAVGEDVSLGPRRPRQVAPLLQHLQHAEDLALGASQARGVRQRHGARPRCKKLEDLEALLQGRSAIALFLAHLTATVGSFCLHR